MKKVAPNSELVNYIWTYLHKGYSLTAIRDSLAQQNYSAKDVNYAIDYVYANYYYGENQNNYKQPNVPGQTMPEATTNSGKMHHSTLMALVVIGILLIGFSFVFVLSSMGGDESSIEPNVPTGREIVLEPDEVDEPVYVEPDDVEVVPDVKPVVKPVETKPVIVPDRVFSGEVKEPFDSSLTYTPRQIELKVDYFSSRNPKEAMNFCDSYSRDVETYFCYRDVAVGSGNSAYCDSIPVQKYKDDCYLSSVLENIDNGASCNKIIDSLKQENCFKIVDINEKAREIEAYVPPDDAGVSNDNAEEYYAVVANFY